MQPASPRDKLFETLPEGRRAGTPAEATRGAFARTGILPSQAIRALIAAGEIKGAPDKSAIVGALSRPTPDRILTIAQAFRFGLSVEEIAHACGYTVPIIRAVLRTPAHTGW